MSHYTKTSRLSFKRNDRSIYRQFRSTWPGWSRAPLHSNPTYIRFFRAQDRHVARCNSLWDYQICQEHASKLNGFSLFFPPLIVSVLIPKMNRRGTRLSANPIMPRGALKSSTETCWEHFLSLNGSRNTCIMNSLQRIGVMRTTPLMDNKA